MKINFKEMKSQAGKEHQRHFIRGFTFEQMLIFVVILGATLAMFPLLKQSISGRLRDSVDSVGAGRQFEPYGPRPTNIIIASAANPECDPDPCAAFNPCHPEDCNTPEPCNPLPCSANPCLAAGPCCDEASEYYSGLESCCSSNPCSDTPCEGAGDCCDTSSPNYAGSPPCCSSDPCSDTPCEGAGDCCDTTSLNYAGEDCPTCKPCAQYGCRHSECTYCEEGIIHCDDTACEACKARYDTDTECRALLKPEAAKRCQNDVWTDCTRPYRELCQTDASAHCNYSDNSASCSKTCYGSGPGGITYLRKPQPKFRLASLERPPSYSGSFILAAPSHPDDDDDISQPGCYSDCMAGTVQCYNNAYAACEGKCYFVYDANTNTPSLTGTNCNPNPYYVPDWQVTYTDCLKNYVTNWDRCVNGKVDQLTKCPFNAPVDNGVKEPYRNCLYNNCGYDPFCQLGPVCDMWHCCNAVQVFENCDECYAYNIYYEYAPAFIPAECIGFPAEDACSSIPTPCGGHPCSSGCEKCCFIHNSLFSDYTGDSTFIINMCRGACNGQPCP